MNKQEKKDKIFDAIFKAVLETGDLASITVSDIALRAGIGKGSVYMYFSNKDQMIFEAAQYFIKSTMQKITEYVYNDKDGFKEVMLGFMAEHIKAMDKYYKIFCAVTNANYFPLLTPALDSKMKGLLEETKKRYHIKLLRLIELGKKDGVISGDHSEFTRLAVAQMLFSAAARHAHEESIYYGMPAREYTKLMYDMAVKMLV